MLLIETYKHNNDIGKNPTDVWYFSEPMKIDGHFYKSMGTYAWDDTSVVQWNDDVVELVRIQLGERMSESR